MTQRFANTIIVVCQNGSNLETQEDVHPEQFVQHTAGSRFGHEKEPSFFFAALSAKINAVLSSITRNLAASQSSGHLYSMEVLLLQDHLEMLVYLRWLLPDGVALI